jgi:hypothetical protein
MLHLLLHDHEDVDQEGEDNGVENQTSGGGAAVHGDGEQTAEDSLDQTVHHGRGDDQEEDRSLEGVHELGVHFLYTL